MLLVEKGVQKIQNELARVGLLGEGIESFKASGYLPKKEFDQRCALFEQRLKSKGHNNEVIAQFFDRNSLNSVLQVRDLTKVALVFVTEKAREPISIVVMGMDVNGEPIYEQARKSNMTPGLASPISKQDIIDGMNYYEARMLKDQFPFDKTRDQGGVHDKEDFRGWLNTVASLSIAYIGVRPNDGYQDIMLLGDVRSLENTNNDEDYAYDRTGGCCTW